MFMTLKINSFSENEIVKMELRDRNMAGIGILQHYKLQIRTVIAYNLLYLPVANLSHS
jgi:hypothetical protein